MRGTGDKEEKDGKELALKSTKGADTPRFIRSQASEFGIRIVYMTASLVCETEGNHSSSWVASPFHQKVNITKRFKV